ncbi:uncharacterized protein LOC133788794 [Humulus lupulus]|uniref:uncharacterized protein LOC133788794 n=1 Tax=Humulus lupulus TaxID=3486 RepID=UPI002B4172DE|nr:uncharacterized protein LOC133788794 [Humulus lupulus]
MSRKYPSWKYSVEIEVPEKSGKKGYKYLKCNFCSKDIKGGVKRVKEHLACTHKYVKPCPKVPKEVKEEISQYLKDYETTKFISQRKFDEAVDCGSYFGDGPSGFGSGNPLEGVNSCPSNSSRGVRGPMDRFMENKGDEENEKNTAATKMTPTSAKEHRNQVCLDIGRFFFENGIPFNCARSPSYFNMLRSVGNYGRGLKAPTMHEMRTWILKEEEKTTSEIVNEIKATWKRTGVSLLSDGWSDMRNRSLINFLVNNPYGTVFLKTIDASDCVKDAQKLFELLDDVVEEIGEDIVIQVVTDNASAYKAAGRLLMEKRKSLYWTPCAAHCIDLMLEKIGELPQHKNALLKAKRVSNFIHNHQWVLSLTRKFAKKDLRPAVTRFATAFLTLESMHQLKQPLQMMFVSKEWSSCAWAKKPEGKAVKKIIMNDNTFWPSVVYSIKTTKPLVNVLRIVDGERTPAMGFIYGVMDEAKEKIAKNLDGDVSSYKEIWEIIDQKWEFQLHRDLHAIAYYLNHRFRWSPNVSEHPEIKTGLYKCMDRLIKDQETYVKVDAQLDEYKYKRGLFGFRSSLTSYLTRPPVEWWDNFGDEVPELKSFATRVLGLTCSASACERNWSTFNQVHTKRRNRLSTKKMNSLVYIMYNKKLKHKFFKKQSRREEDDPLIVENVSSDDEWVANPNDEEDGDSRAIEVGGEIEIEDEGGSLAPRKRKRNQAPIEVNLDEEDEFEGGEDDSEDGDDGRAIQFHNFMSDDEESEEFLEI